AARHVETVERRALRHAHQLAFERITPMVVRTRDEVTAVAFLRVEQARRPMTANVIEAAQLAVLAAHGDDGLAKQVEAVVVANLRNVVAIANQLPAGAKDRALLQLEELGVVVDPTRQSEVILVRVSRPRGLNGGAHGLRIAAWAGNVQPGNRVRL